MHRIIHTFKKILQLLFNRIFYVAVALMLQLAWLMITVWRLAAYSKYISNAIAIISVLVVLWIVNKKINPSYKLGWTILILVSPVFGVMLYLLFGKSRIAQAIQNKYAQVQKESIPFMEPKKQSDIWKLIHCLLQYSPTTFSDIPVSRYTKIPPQSIFRWEMICFLFLSANLNRHSIIFILNTSSSTMA